MRTLVVGLGVTGESVARRMAIDGPVTVVEDTPGPSFVERAERLAGLGVDVVAVPGEARLTEFVSASDLVVPSPGVPEAHAVYRIAEQAGTRLVSEIELAGQDAAASGRPLVAVTGTNGKTTVTMLITAMLSAAGLRAIAAGNIGRPLIDAVADDVDVVVAEVSSFQLRFTETFRPGVAVLLNVAPDHLDWHPDFEAYVKAKARIFANQTADDYLVFNADDEAVAKVAATAASYTIPFSIRPGGRRDNSWRLVGDELAGLHVPPFMRTSDLARNGPHDIANALAAAAAAETMGAKLNTFMRSAVIQVLASFTGLPHRVTPVGQSGGVRYVDDSKATNPHAALAAIRGFDSVVLVAGGRNKGLDLGVLAAEAARIRAVVAIGEAAAEVAGAFDGVRPVRTATSMDEAVRHAADLAQPGDVVLLSPACASFDWYSGYGARGDDFAACAQALIAEQGRA